MKTIQGARLTALVGTIAVAAALASPLCARAATHDHGASAPQKLSLNQGQRWATDEALRSGMGRIRALVEPQIGAAHLGKLTAAQYRDLAAKVESEIGAIVANCKLEPEADAMLHLVIADLGAGADAMAGKSAKLAPSQGLAKVVQALGQYGRYFHDPGFKPIGARS